MICVYIQTDYSIQYCNLYPACGAVWSMALGAAPAVGRARAATTYHYQGQGRLSAPASRVVIVTVASVRLGLLKGLNFIRIPAQLQYTSNSMDHGPCALGAVLR